jgi:hypothetical protein
MHIVAMDERTDGKRRWGLEQRLEFIEFRLFWEGMLNRGDLADRFGVSTVQASTDLARYRELAPDNIDYDASQKRFIATKKFSPILGVPNADRYLVQLKSIGDRIISVTDTSIGATPTIDAMPIPHRRVDPDILRGLVRAIRGQTGVNAYYHSMNSQRPLPVWRAISPHALAFDGLRWHVRGYCHSEKRFKDFVLSRILELGAEVEAGKPAGVDAQWHEIFDVVLIPNPRLAPAQRETVARDYEMTDGQLTIPVRRALLYYFNKRLRLDVAEETDEPKETPVVLLNRVEFQRALEQAL